jgi:hypothetical protein
MGAMPASPLTLAAWIIPRPEPDRRVFHARDAGSCFGEAGR